MHLLVPEEGNIEYRVHFGALTGPFTVQVNWTQSIHDPIVSKKFCLLEVEDAGKLTAHKANYPWFLIRIHVFE